MLQRRSFLASMLLAGAAPAVVRASSLMKIYVPSAKPFLYPTEIGKIEEFRFISDPRIHQRFNDLVRRPTNFILLSASFDYEAFHRNPRKS